MTTQRKLVDIHKMITKMMEQTGASTEDHARLDAIISSVAQQVGVQPDALVLYEEEGTIHVGARAPREMAFTPMRELLKGEALNAKPDVMPNPFGARDAT